VDAGLSDTSFILLGRSIVQRRVKPRTVVEALDVLEDREAGLLSRSVVLLIDELGLERVEEALDRGVVEAVAAGVSSCLVAIERKRRFVFERIPSSRMSRATRWRPQAIPRC